MRGRLIGVGVTALVTVDVTIFTLSKRKDNCLQYW
jgi:hypothetical protein